MRLPALQSANVAGPAGNAGFSPAITGVSPSAAEACVTLTTENGQVCLDIPVVGKQCISVSLPDGVNVQGCVKTCEHFGVPTGACATLSAFNQQLITQCFGWC